MNIHQLSISYQPEQDRILVQINTLEAQELRLWLTRRLVIDFLPHLHRLMVNLAASNVQLTTADDATKKMVTEFKKHESISKTDFKTPYNPKASAYPVGETPILVTTVQLTPDDKGGLRIGFEEKFVAASPQAAAPRGFQMTMASTLLHGFTHLLESAIKISGWDILNGQRLTSEAPEPDSNGSASSGRPAYLN